ncbi:hypothetical protein GW17_00032477 [Ensete ventricosum]|nr:hypothetical protein GW17_00032477 [Ensete ventricosum]RZS11011.1 hypothetical protein BHM03_00042291 [Ensete ventricosum]
MFWSSSLEMVTSVSLILIIVFLGIIIAGSSYDTDPTSTTVAASEEVLVPGAESDDLSSSTDIISDTVASSGNLQVSQETTGLMTEESEAGQTSISSEFVGEESMDDDVKGAVSSQAIKRIEEVQEKPRFVRPPGTGQRIYEIDPSLKGYRGHLDYRYDQYKKMRETIDQYEGGLDAFSRGYEKFGFQRRVRVYSNMCWHMLVLISNNQIER